MVVPKLLTTFFLLSFSISCLRAQTVLTGTVRDTQDKPLEGVLVEVETVANPPVSAFSISDAAGGYILRLPVASADSLRLQARALNYAPQERRLRNQSQQTDFRLRAEATQLKEVVVKSDPIRRQGDTLSYNVGSTDPKDRVIADVLRKLPGIEIEADGRILYEGKPIQKFYIDGVDLLEGRYNLASNNLPAGAVRDVQVLENHQPIRALDSLVRSDRASLRV